MDIAYIGNFGPAHSTENEVRKALDKLGHDVWLCQEGDRRRFDELVARVHEFDVVLWTRTKDLCDRIPVAAQRRLLLDARRAGVPTVAYHLDRWWGLREHGREDSVWTEPYFRCEHFFSTDGAHDAEWAAAGVNHHWMPPAVSEFECSPGTPRAEWQADVGFLGSVRHYHGEHPHRVELVRWLRDTYGDRFKQFPGDGQPGIRGDDLRDLIASVKVWVGDSCLAPTVTGRPMRRYWSDRVPEVTGRGGFLLHPEVDGLSDQHPPLSTWPMGNWSMLKALIDGWLVMPEPLRVAQRERGRQWTLAHHTYTVRMAQVLETVCPS